MHVFRLTPWLVGLFFGLLPGVLAAHEIDASGNSFLVGLRHPVLGLDHLLAMIAVGIVSALAGGKKLWLVPLVFVLHMLFGGLLGGYAVPLPGIESGIIFSVIALGVVLAIDQRIPQLATVTLIAYFGVMHGYAHGSEMPEMSKPILYGSGFITGTIGLHLFGVLIGIAANRLPRGHEVVRVTGGAVSCLGIYWFLVPTLA